MNDQTPGLGHNQPDELPYDIEAYEKLEEGIERFNTAASEWLKLEAIETDEQAQKLTDFIAGARKLRQLAEKTRKEQKAPWDAKAKAVQSAFVTLIDRIDKIAKAPNALQAEWLKRKREEAEKARLEKIREAEEAKRRAEELERQAEARTDMAGLADAEKAKKEAEKLAKQAARETKVKAGSASGGTRAMGLRTVKSAKVTNLPKLFMHYKDHPEVEEVLVRLANADLRNKNVDDASIPGIEIITEEKAV